MGVIQALEDGAGQKIHPRSGTVVELPAAKVEHVPSVFVMAAYQKTMCRSRKKDDEAGARIEAIYVRREREQLRTRERERPARTETSFTPYLFKNDLLRRFIILLSLELKLYDIY